MRNLLGQPRRPQNETDLAPTTETEESGQFYDGDSIPVHMTMPVPRQRRSEAAERVSYNTYIMAPGVIQPLWPFNPRRKEVQLFFTNLGGTPKFTVHYDQAQLSQGGGAQLTSANANGQQWEFKNQRAGYGLTVAGTCTVTVVDEWYDTASDYEGE